MISESINKKYNKAVDLKAIPLRFIGANAMTTKRSDSTSKRTAKEKPPARTNTTSAKTGTKAVPDEMADTLDKPTLEKTKKKV